MFTTCNWHLKWEPSCGTELFTCGVCAHSGWFCNWIELGDTSLHQRIGQCGEKTTHPLSEALCVRVKKIHGIFPRHASNKVMCWAADGKETSSLALTCISPGPMVQCLLIQCSQWLYRHSYHWQQESAVATFVPAVLFVSSVSCVFLVWSFSPFFCFLVLFACSEYFLVWHFHFFK